MTEDEKHAFQKHAIAAYPNECLGVLTPDGYHALENVSQSPHDSATVPDEYYAMVDKGEALALCHSHPDGYNCPSKEDMISQIAADIPFYIVVTNGEACFDPFGWGDTLPVPKLKRRPFRHGVTDCYALIRDAFRVVHGVTMSEYPRDWAWWEADGGGENFYETKAGAQGWHEIDPRQAGSNDLLLFNVRWSRNVDPSVINHAGILLDDKTFLHHTASNKPWDPQSISGAQPLGRWGERIAKVLRHEKHSALRPLGEALRERSHL